eukprot:CAMPEP_0182493360 /NCGR_PEP_ID=MMETSP1321-20130603/2324_1 /TAXON_ID=91990 /ORGANISM="Bolidomonas sp., Strain RCC1657" /LENGTH=418 /DNA_ID=CAMNT_0024696095 /DNA_START=110 /DNA_END=1366 /DNA_ORIENTATION=+
MPRVSQYADERQLYECILVYLYHNAHDMFGFARLIIAYHSQGLLPLPLSSYILPLLLRARMDLTRAALCAAVLRDSSRQYWGPADPPGSVDSLNLTDNHFIDLFRFRKADFEDLFRRLAEDLPGVLPWPLTGPNPHKYPLFVGLLTLLLRLSQKNSMVLFMNLLRMDEKRISEAWRSCCTLLANCYGDSLVDMKRWAFLSKESMLAYRSYNLCPCPDAAAAIDGKYFTIAKPVDTGYEHYTFCGQKKKNGLLMLVAVSAQGLAIFAGGPFPGRLSDSRAANHFDVRQRVRDWRDECVAQHGNICRNIHLIGDGGFISTPEILSSFFNPPPGSPQARWNAHMHKVRVTVEMFFGNIVRVFPFIGEGKQFKIGCAPFGPVMTTSFLLHNLFTTYHRGNNISRQLGTELPTVEKVFEVMKG